VNGKLEVIRYEAVLVWPGICLVGLRVTMKILRQVSSYSIRGLNPVSLDYEAGVQITRPPNSKVRQTATLFLLVTIT